MADLRPIPTLDRVAEHPEDAARLPRDAVLALHARAVRALAALEGPLLAAANGAHPEPPRPDLFDDIGEAARLIGRTPHFIYRHHRSLPFVVQEGRGRRLRFSRLRIERFLDEQRGG